MPLRQSNITHCVLDQVLSYKHILFHILKIILYYDMLCEVVKFSVFQAVHIWNLAYFNKNILFVVLADRNNC